MKNTLNSLGQLILRNHAIYHNNISTKEEKSLIKDEASKWIVDKSIQKAFSLPYKQRLQETLLTLERYRR